MGKSYKHLNEQRIADLAALLNQSDYKSIRRHDYVRIDKHMNSSDENTKAYLNTLLAIGAIRWYEEFSLAYWVYPIIK